MIKIVLNKCHGSFQLSEEAKKWILLNTSEKDVNCFHMYKERTRWELVKCVEALGIAANAGFGTKLHIEEFDDTLFDYRIVEYDGFEKLELIPKILTSKLSEYMENHDLSGLINHLKKLKINVGDE